LPRAAWADVPKALQVGVKEHALDLAIRHAE
jgi:hypothetical protein